MGFRPDYRKMLRAQANAIQDENQDRLLSGETVSGGQVAPRAQPSASSRSRRRIRLAGIRVAVKELAGRAGVKTGEMAKDSVRRSNVKLGRTSFKIVPAGKNRVKWFVFNAGSKHQRGRPVSGISEERMASVIRAAANETVAQQLDYLRKRRKR